MQQRMQELVKLLNEYARAYYAFDAPKVSDAQYDALFDELLHLEQETGQSLIMTQNILIVVIIYQK